MITPAPEPEAPRPDAGTAPEQPERPPGPVQRGQRFEFWMRLLRPAQFSHVYRFGGRARGHWVTVAVAPNELGCTRIGLSIGKRVFKRAVPRNRVRRMMREAFRLSYDDLPAGVDLVIIGSEPAIVPDLESLRIELVKLSHEALQRRRKRRSPKGTTK